MSKGRALELFFVEGDPEGLATAEVVNWTGHVLRVPRNAIKIALKREEAKRTGCYILRGSITGETHLYVGEGERIGERIARHDIERDWWSEAYFLTTTSDFLHKAHVKYLEARLVERATDVGKVKLENNTKPTKSSLSEAATASMEEYLEILNIALGALGFQDFSTGVRATSPIPSQETYNTTNPTLFYLKTPKNKVQGTAYLDGSSFIVKSGSRARREWAGQGE
ncbi:MAG: GIY-YIG nuclease family protein, partial [Pseudomonadota bacterium]